MIGAEAVQESKQERGREQYHGIIIVAGNRLLDKEIAPLVIWTPRHPGTNPPSTVASELLSTE
jgi:hypothetical protein